MSSDYANTDDDDCGYCTTAGDLGIGAADGMSRSVIAYLNPHCPDHGSAEAVATEHSSSAPGCAVQGGQ